MEYPDATGGLADLAFACQPQVSHNDFRPVLAPSIEDLEQFVDFGLAVARRTRAEGMRDTVLEVTRKDFLLDLVQRRANRADLGENVYAVPFLFHHPGKSSNLTFDAI